MRSLKLTQSLTESLEDYLEAIYNIIHEKKGVRVKDISNYLTVKNSSVTSALKSLEKEGFINYEPYGIISLTEKGNELSKKITERHKILKYFFMNVLFIDKELSDQTACKIEHGMPEPVFKKFIQFIKYIYLNHKNNPEWFNRFKDFCSKNEIDVNSESGIDDYFIDTNLFQ